MKTSRPTRVSGRRGFVLVAVLVFVLLLSMVTLSLLFRSQGDEMASLATAGSEQAWSAAMSGVQEAMRVAGRCQPGSTDWLDDPGSFRGRSLYQDGADEWFYSVFCSTDNDALTDTRYGLSDEASRLNINHPGNADLLKVPGMTAALLTTLQQFVGLDSTNAMTWEEEMELPVDAPAEPALSATDQALSQVRVARHGPLTTLDQLLLAPGISRAVLHGSWAPPDDLEMAPSNRVDEEILVDSALPRRIRGLDQYFSVYSKDPNRTSAGQPRCNLNDTNAVWPTCDLPAAFSNYVAAARAANVRIAHPSELLEATLQTHGEAGAEAAVSSGITKENLATVLDLFTADADSMKEGLINVNTASSAVLATLPGIDVPLAESIVSTRAGLSPERRATTAWLLQEGVMDTEKYKAIAPHLTTRSSQFSFNAIGYGLPSGRFRVLEVVVDASGGEARLLYLRDITRLGLPISLKEENPADPNTPATRSQVVGAENSRHSHG